MSKKRPIDIQREAAITLQIGGDDKSVASDFLSTSNSLYVIKESGVYQIQLADDIDPDRTNPHIPNINQQVLPEGHDNEIVARILLTAKYLFDEKNATVKPFVGKIFETCITLTRHVLELHQMANDLSDEISKKEQKLAATPAKPNAFILPSVPTLETKVHNILSKADKAKDNMLSICRLHFIPEAESKVRLENLDRAIKKFSERDPELVSAWEEIFNFFTLLRNMRNVSEHPKENYQAALTDFTMHPDGTITPPLIEIQHPDTPIRILPVNELLEFVQNMVLDHAETTIAFIRCAYLLDNNPFNERVAEFQEKERRHKHVRYYRAINVGGAWRMLG